MKVNLFRSVDKDIKYSSRFILSLDCFFGIKLEVEVPHRKYVIVTSSNQFRYWSLCDNGQELNLVLVNDESQTVGIPSTHYRFEILPEIMAYRVAKIIAEGYGAVDWNFNDMPSLEEGYGYPKQDGSGPLALI